MSERNLRADLSVRGLIADLADLTRPRVSLDRLDVVPAEGAFEDLRYRAAGLRVDGLRVDAQGTRADRVSVKGLTLSAPGLEVRVGSVSLPQGIQIDPSGAIRIPAAVLGQVQIAVDDVSKRAAGSGACAGASPGQDRDQRPAPSFEFLDKADGHLNVDLFLDLGVPVLGRRRETHRFRIPIADGAFNYAELEADIHWLERSFIDIEVVDGKLVLEKDISWVPFDGKALVWWPLDPDELALSKRKRVRLETLLGYELPPAVASSKEPAVKVNEVAARRIDVALDLGGGHELSLGATGRIQLGHAGGPAISGLSLTGDLHFDAAGSTHDTSLFARIDFLDAGLADIRAGELLISAGRARVGPVEDLTLEFSGLRPTSLRGAIGGVEIADLCVGPVVPSADGTSARSQEADGPDA